MYTHMIYKAVNNFFNDSFAFQKLGLAVNLTFNVFQIPVHKLTASYSTVFICTATGIVLDRELKCQCTLQTKSMHSSMHTGMFNDWQPQNLTWQLNNLIEKFYLQR